MSHNIPHRKARNHPKAEKVILNEKISEFKHHQDPGFKEKTAELVSSVGIPIYRLIGAEMFVETATSPELDVIEKQALLERGKKGYEDIYRQGVVRKNGLSHEAGHAALRLATFDSTQWVIAGEQLPPLSVVEENYSKLFRTCLELDRSRTNGLLTPEDRFQLTGAEYEGSVLLLLMRFILRERDTEYGAAFSLLSEDHADNRGSYLVGRWDVSAFTQYAGETTPQVKHRIQVKSSREASEHFAEKSVHEYDETRVSVVYARQDLALSQRHPVFPNTIPSECYEVEVNCGNHDKLVEQRLDRRIDKLLDLI
ncbi:MAG TPA: hypothetical protein PKB09_02585 [Candidatus Saccharibacteria bacterium]|nr:hypothetical protein [Candidatus Saccharibacteria bacterium]